MGSHFHLVVRMHPEDEASDEEIIKRYKKYYGDDKYLAKEQVSEVRKRLCSLAAYVKDIKQGSPSIGVGEGKPSPTPILGEAQVHARRWSGGGVFHEAAGHMREMLLCLWHQLKNE